MRRLFRLAAQRSLDKTVKATPLTPCWVEIEPGSPEGGDTTFEEYISIPPNGPVVRRPYQGHGIR